MDKDAVIALLQGAKERIAQGWCQNVLLTSESVCLYGGLNYSYHKITGSKLMHPEYWGDDIWNYNHDVARPFKSPVYAKAVEALIAATGVRTYLDLAPWNNHWQRTQAEVMDACDRAIRWVKDQPE